MVERCDISSLPFFCIMIINLTYTRKQYWSTVIISGLLLSVLLSVVYIMFYKRLYLTHSYIFSIIYLIPVVWLSATVAFFKMKFVWGEFTYWQAFLMSMATGCIGSVLFSVAIFILFYFNLLHTKISLFENGAMLRHLFSPQATALSMLLINLILTLIYSLILSIFVRKKQK